MILQPRRHLLLVICIASLAALSILTSSPVSAVGSGEFAWKAQIDVLRAPQVVVAQGGVLPTRDTLRDQIAAAVSKQGVQSDVQVWSTTAQGSTYRVTLQGSGGSDQFRQTLYVDLKSQLDLLGGPISLSVTGAVAVDQEVAVVLESRPGTGYSWAVEGSETLLKAVGQTVKQKGDGPGVPAQVTLSFKATGRGRAALTLVYRRAWEEALATRQVWIEASALPALIDLSSPVAPPTLQPKPTSEATKPGLPPQLTPPQPKPTQSTAGVLPASFDWHAQGKDTAIKNQGYCGSCWAFASVGAMEAAIKIRTSTDTDLSEQYLVSCNSYGYSCDGGLLYASDFHWWRQGLLSNPAGAVLESAMPYTATNGSCGLIASHPYKLDYWVWVDPTVNIPTVDQIKTAIYNNGPVAAAVCAGDGWDTYSGGIFSTDESAYCGGAGHANHAIVLTGWDDATQTWMLRNSWGTYWGDNGYMHIRYGISNVGLDAINVTYGTPPPVVANDLVSNAIAVSAAPYSNTQSILGALSSPTDPPMTGCVGTNYSSSVWYRYTPSGSGTATVDTLGSSTLLDTVLGVYTGTEGSMTQVACNDDYTGRLSRLTFSATASTLYYIVAGTYYTSPNTYDGALQLHLTGPAPVVANPIDTIGGYNATNGVFYLRTANASGPANFQFQFGPAGAGWLPIAGDWNGDGVVTIGGYNPTNGVFYLRNSNASGNADYQFQFGPAGAGWLPLAGDWNGDGTDTIGGYNPANGVFYLRNTNNGGPADYQFQFGPAGAGWLPLAGDWNGDGTDTIGGYNPTNGVFYLRNSNAGGNADYQFQFGPAGAGWKPLAGDWNGDGAVTIGGYNPTNGVFYLRNTNNGGNADYQFQFGPAGAGWLPIAGDWNGPLSAVPANPVATVVPVQPIAPTFVPSRK